MKYKVFGIVACAIVVVFAMTVSIASDPKTERYHQHLEAVEKAECTDHGDEVFCTHLPLVCIDTDGQEIPGVPVRNEEGSVIGYSTAQNGETTITAHMDIVDNLEVMNHVTDQSTISSEIKMRVRGRSSRLFEKKSYAIRLVTKEGENNPQEVMGMDTHHEWVLYGPILDKTLIRNYMWYNISGEIMDYAPNVRFCEVMLDGNYDGLYLMVEEITAGQDGSRLELKVDKKDNEYTGYLLRMNSLRPHEAPDAVINHFSYYTYVSNDMIEVLYPGKMNLTEEMKENICQDFSSFEKALFSYDYDSKEFGYVSYIDVDSFVDYMVINEFTSNSDAGSISTYLYKDIDGKYKMCVWDFNSACDNYQEQKMDINGFYVIRKNWFINLVKDERFNQQVIERYHELRQSYLCDEYLNTYIDETIAYLGDAVARNEARWGNDTEFLMPTDRNLYCYEDAVRQLKDNISARGKWLDENVEVLLQYSSESAVKNLNANAD